MLGGAEENTQLKEFVLVNWGVTPKRVGVGTSAHIFLFVPLKKDNRFTA
jgi:hypothetical protein